MKQKLWWVVICLQFLLFSTLSYLPVYAETYTSPNKNTPYKSGDIFQPKGTVAKWVSASRIEVSGPLGPNFDDLSKPLVFSDNNFDGGDYHFATKNGSCSAYMVANDNGKDEIFELEGGFVPKADLDEDIGDGTMGYMLVYAPDQLSEGGADCRVKYGRYLSDSNDGGVYIELKQPDNRNIRFIYQDSGKKLVRSDGKAEWTFVACDEKTEGAPPECNGNKSYVRQNESKANEPCQDTIVVGKQIDQYGKKVHRAVLTEKTQDGTDCDKNTQDFLIGGDPAAKENKEYGVSANAGAESNSNDTQCDSGTVFTWAVCGIINFALDTMDWIQKSVIEPFLTVSPLTVDNPSFSVWKGVRTLANLLLVPIFIVIIYSAAINNRQ